MVMVRRCGTLMFPGSDPGTVSLRQARLRGPTSWPGGWGTAAHEGVQLQQAQPQRGFKWEPLKKSKTSVAGCQSARKRVSPPPPPCWGGGFGVTDPTSVPPFFDRAWGAQRDPGRRDDDIHGRVMLLGRNMVHHLGLECERHQERGTPPMRHGHLACRVGWAWRQ